MKTTATFGIHFKMRFERMKNGKAPVMMGLSINSHKCYVSLKNYQVETKHWDKNSGSGLRSTAGGRKINEQLDQYRTIITDCYRQLQSNHRMISLEAIKTIFLGSGDPDHTLSNLLEKHTKKANAELAETTMRHYRVTERYLFKYLKVERNRKDIFLHEIDYGFLSEFDTFLRNHKPLDHQRPINNNGVMKHMTRLRKIIGYGLKLKWITENPFISYEFKFDRVTTHFLNKFELADLVEKKFTAQRLTMVRDMFVFSCYTGLAYSDLMQLQPLQIVIGCDGKYWIDTARQKTDVKVRVPLLAIARKILEQYQGNLRAQARGNVFPHISNQKYNSYLKEIADLTNLRQNLTSHIARHTFATTVTLSNGVPIESVSKMLGHTKIATTQIYAKILDEKVSRDMDDLERKLC